MADSKLNLIQECAVELMVRRGEMCRGPGGELILTRKGRRAMEQRRKKEERNKEAYNSRSMFNPKVHVSE